MTGNWTSAAEVDSLRARKALAYGDKLSAIVNGETGETWDEALLPLIDPARFVRRGNERAELDWPAYRGLLDQWVAHGGTYAKTLHRASEVGNLVYLDMDERSDHADGSVGTLRSISIYEFDESDRIVGVDVIMGFTQPQ